MLFMPDNLMLEYGNGLRIFPEVKSLVGLPLFGNPTNPAFIITVLGY